MSSEVDICNLALSHLGDEAEVAAIDPPDGSIQAAHCGRYYPMARDVLLESHPWPFATKRAAVARLDNPLEDDWSYAYALPSACLRPLSALLPGQPEQVLSLESDNGSHPYIVEAGEDGGLVLFTNIDAATLRYIARIEDPTKFPPGFTIALSRLLAAYLAGPILKGDKGMAVAERQLTWFEREFRRAAAMAANVGKRSTYETRQPTFIAARGGLTLTNSWPRS